MSQHDDGAAWQADFYPGVDRAPMTGPIAPDARREEVADALSEASASFPVDDYIEAEVEGGEIDRAFSLHQADAVLAMVAKDRDAEVERLRAVVDFQRTRGDLAYATSDSIRAERDAAQDRIARALHEIEFGEPDDARAILRGEA